MEIIILVVIVLYLMWRFIVNPDLAERITVKQWIQFIGVVFGAVFVATIIIVFGRLLIDDLEDRNLFSFLALCIIVIASWVAFGILKKFTPVIIQKVLGFNYEK